MSERWYIELPKRSGDYERISRELWKNIQRVVKEYPRKYIRISKKLEKTIEKSAFEYLGNDIQTIWKSFSFIILKWWRSYDRKKKSLRFSSERSPRDFRLLYVMRQLIAAAVYSACALRQLRNGFAYMVSMRSRRNFSSGLAIFTFSNCPLR